MEYIQPIRIENPVLKSARYIMKNNDHVSIDHSKVHIVAKQLEEQMKSQHFCPASWRQQPLHLKPPIPLDPSHPGTKKCLDWIFLVSALNFSFWSELEGSPRRYGVRWKPSWEHDPAESVKWDGYWSLLAALNKALENGIPITDPKFYASKESCPDSLIRDIFAPTSDSAEEMPLLAERIAVMREVGKVFIEQVPGQSYLGLLTHSNSIKKPNGNGSALLLNLVVQYFPCFRDEAVYNGREAVFWKRAQILIAETWAAFHPGDSVPPQPHPFLPDGVDYLTMFADYRVPQILQHLGVLVYSEQLRSKLINAEAMDNGSLYEMCIRAGGVIAVEELKMAMLANLDAAETNDSLQTTGTEGKPKLQVNSVLIDFFLWDLAKLIETMNDREGNQVDILPCHRTRSIFY